MVGVNNGDSIYYRVGLSHSKPQGNRWIHVGGRLTMIDVSGMTVIGVNRGQQTWKSPVDVRGEI